MGLCFLLVVRLCLRVVRLLACLIYVFEFACFLLFACVGDVLCCL